MARRELFDQGYASLCRCFPEIAAAQPEHPFYVCPQCLGVFTENALALKWLSMEHVPPRSVGGKRMVLTCRNCNHGSGHEIDAHMRREADVYDFLTGNLTAPIRAKLSIDGGSVPIQMTASERQYSVAVVSSAAHPEAIKAVQGRFSSFGHDVDHRPIWFRLEPYSGPNAEAAWLRSCYLAFFATFGYRFVVRPELGMVRECFKHPAETRLRCRMVRRERAPEPMLIAVGEPAAFRCFAMVYQHQIVMLPTYGDHDFYVRLAQQPKGYVELQLARRYPWPLRPLFLHDGPSDRTDDRTP